MNSFFEASKEHHIQIQDTYSQLQERMKRRQIEELQIAGRLFINNGRLIVKDGNILPISGANIEWFLLLQFIYEKYEIKDKQESEETETIRFIPEAVPILIEKLNQLAT